MLLGRRLLAPLAADAQDPALRRIQQDDRFFCETMESIPAQYYFPTDEEENWRRSQPKSARKYHRVRVLSCTCAHYAASLSLFLS